MANKSAYAADFETTTDSNDCRVWAWGIESINKNNSYSYGNSIDSFFENIYSINKSSVVYFHNLKFDGQFILSYILKNGYKRNDKRKENTYDTVIDDMLKFYEIRITFKNKKGKNVSIKFHDSLKKINMPIRKMPKAFGLDIEKGDLDKTNDSYEKYRPVGHELTEEEKDYLYRDVHILSQSLKFLYDNGLDSMTIAGGAMKEFKNMIGKDTFNRYFPVLPFNEDNFCRKSYRGGWTYCLKEQIVKYGLVFDVNSLYPSVLYSDINGRVHLYPKGRGVYYKGKGKSTDLYPLYIQRIRVDFHIKKNHLPMIQLQKSAFSIEKEYATDSNGIVELYLTSVDLELFMRQYDIDYIEYVDGYKYRAQAGLFDNYIDKFMNMKVKAKKEDNNAMATLAKLYLNSLYGKFGMSKIVKSKYPVLEDGVVKYKTTHYDINGEDYDYLMKDGYYVPVACFCTAYAREVTVTMAQRLHEEGRFCYADTDSVHITGTEIPEYIPIDKTKLGYWDHESTFDEAIFIRAKTYAEHSEYGWNLKCAGMPAKMKQNLLEYCKKNNKDIKDVFKVGFVSTDYDIKGKMRPEVVKGGMVLKESPFQIKQK